MDPMHVPELSAMIAEHLTLADIKACTTVCKAWRRTLHPRLWSTFVLDTRRPPTVLLSCSFTAPCPTYTAHCQTHPQCAHHYALQKNAHWIRQLTLHYIREHKHLQHLPRALYEILAEQCSSLTRLTLDIDPTFWHIVKRMLLNNPGLRILVFKTQGHRAWLSPEMLIEALTCCPNLKELTLATELAPSFYTTARAGSGSGMGGSGTGNGMSQWGEKTSRTAGDDDDVSLPPMNHGLQKLTVRSEYDQRLDSLLAQCPRLEQLAILSLNTLAARDLCNQLCSPSFSTLLQSSSPSSTSSVSAPSYYSSFSRLSKLELGSGQYQHKVLAALTDCTEQSLPALHSLTLHYPSDRAIQAIANDSHMVHRLEHLDIRLGFDPCNGLVDLLKRCQGLKRLSITAQGNPSFIDIARLLPITDSKVSIMNRAGGSSTTTMTTLEKKVAATTSKSTWACLQLEELQLSVGLLCPHRMKEGLLTQWQRIGNVEQEVAVNHEKSRDKEDHDQGACQENVRDVEEDAFQISHVSLVTHGGCTCLDCAKAETRLMRQLGCLTQLRRLEIVQPSRLAMQPGQQDLSWRLDRGLGYLAGLSQLREVDLGQSTAFLGGVEELRWMKKHWVALRRLVCAKVYYETSRFWLCAQWPELRVVELAC